MNQLSVVIVALVVFTYFGGSYVPSVLKSNKQMLLGVVGGLVLGSFFGVRLVEGSLLKGLEDIAKHPVDVTTEVAEEEWQEGKNDPSGTILGALEDAIVLA